MFSYITLHRQRETYQTEKVTKLELGYRNVWKEEVSNSILYCFQGPGYYLCICLIPFLLILILDGIFEFI